MANDMFRTDGEARRAAEFWIAEFGGDAGWHISRKIDDLVAWGDPTGAAALRRVRRAVRRREAGYFAAASKVFARLSDAIAATGARRSPFGFRGAAVRARIR